MIRKLFIINTQDIKIFHFIIEGYERMATVSTLDPRKAVIQVLIMPDFQQEMKTILSHLQDIITMIEIPVC